jgi:hypothetical protein
MPIAEGGDCGNALSLSMGWCMPTGYDFGSDNEDDKYSPYLTS